MIFALLLSNCLGTKKSKAEVAAAVITQNINFLMQQKGTPALITKPPNSAPLINPDPERTDPRYLLSSEETEYVLKEETALRDAEFFEEKSFELMHSDLKDAVYFIPPTQDDLDAYSDELELGIPHKKRTLTRDEEKNREKELNEKTELMISGAGAQLPNLKETELKEFLFSVNLKIHLSVLLTDSISFSDLEKSVFQKNQEMMVYLRRRIIAEMIARGIR